ncbi:MAG TPA: biotin carboxylase N-terminal domain-containing protein, partial [Prolixibacteraceae bacterium]
MEQKPIKKVLVANRGEIAIRVMRSCREMGIETVAVFSDADRTAMHVRYANEAYNIGPAPSSESYLNIDKIIETAKKSGSDAIHPGYGFLSENAAFARRCREEGLRFIGPSPESIEMMGDKISARKKMIAAGVPVVPGTTTKVTSEAEAVKYIREIGLPVMIKASAGGGGKGMRLVKKESQIASSLRAARSEA